MGMRYMNTAMAIVAIGFAMIAISMAIAVVHDLINGDGTNTSDQRTKVFVSEFEVTLANGSVLTCLGEDKYYRFVCDWDHPR